MIVQKIIIVAVEFLPDTPIDVIDIASVISLGWLFAQPQWIALRTHPNKTESYRTDVTNMHPGLCKTGKKNDPPHATQLIGMGTLLRYTQYHFR